MGDLIIVACMHFKQISSIRCVVLWPKYRQNMSRWTFIIQCLCCCCFLCSSWYLDRSRKTSIKCYLFICRNVFLVISPLISFHMAHCLNSIFSNALRCVLFDILFLTLTLRALVNWQQGQSRWKVCTFQCWRLGVKLWFTWTILPMLLVKALNI